MNRQPHCLSQKSLAALSFVTVLATQLASLNAWGADAPKGSAKAPTAPAEPTLEGSVVNVDQIKEKYWARGDENEMGVVQNRAYSKANKITLGVLGGAITSDPFYNNSAYGFNLGYHFSEYISLSALAWRSISSPSSALLTYQSQNRGAINSNPQYAYYGGEIAGSILYGKLSVIGKSIIYYDLHLLAGAGMTGTENGNFLTGHLGIGQRFFLSKRASLRVDYRLMLYNENIVEKVITPQIGQTVGTRVNYSNAITAGVDFFFEVFKK